MKLLSFCIAKDIIARVKGQSIKLEKISASCTSDRKLVSRLYKELEQLNSVYIYRAYKCVSVKGGLGQQEMELYGN